MVESTENGWWYTVQIASGKMVSTFMTDPKVISQSSLSQDLFWKQELEKSIHTKKRLSSFIINDRVSTQSAHSHLAPQIQGKNWLKVGDAAQSFDPLSSAGIIKGFKMGILAADALNEYNKGDSNALQLYEEEIRRQYFEYEVKRDEYYLQETRWVSSPFWYKRILRLKDIHKFTITPMNRFNIHVQNVDQKIDFLNNQLPEINFNTLYTSVQEFPLIKDAITNYLNKEQQTQMNPTLLYALEGLKIIDLIQEDKNISF